MVSSPSVHINVHRPSRAISPLMTCFKSPENQIATIEMAYRLTVHEHSFCYIICIMPRYDVIYSQRRSASIQRLSTEYTTERAIILLANLRNDGVHCPAVELVIRKDFERNFVL